MDNLNQLLQLLQCADPSGLKISLAAIFCFISLATSLKNDILLVQLRDQDISKPPANLSPSLSCFLSAIVLPRSGSEPWFELDFWSSSGWFSPRFWSFLKVQAGHHFQHGQSIFPSPKSIYGNTKDLVVECNTYESCIKEPTSSHYLSDSGTGAQSYAAARRHPRPMPMIAIPSLPTTRYRNCSPDTSIAHGSDPKKTKPDHREQFSMVWFWVQIFCRTEPMVRFLVLT
ncbi:uncharacterized protein F5891DRAFT_978935 [Suillus fuscotomentosus]|uniref:Uncharacterized protein n=1 Tax=Suillus fuscotomentosus TaxID=1912939 RepID=A0AAD4HMN3_9AGAM|nr:uncharacterized protein F5891DRAFT_978935 [Suillus fuscotomentosus]KAG1902233.1 hypothetical protein F5891DRAFT_978935 [Suillus fuscotomentosus]